MSGNDQPILDATDAAQALAKMLQQRGHEYAIGGAIALGYWGQPRGTVDVDVTIFLEPGRPSSCLHLLEEMGCEVNDVRALDSLREHGFCQIRYLGVRVDVFLPTIPFYETARQRRRRVRLGENSIAVWDPEVLAVFKMMFFRRKDVADVEQIIRVQGTNLDRAWVRDQLVDMYGKRDPRIPQWDELTAEINS